MDIDDLSLTEDLNEIRDKYYSDIPEDIFLKILAIDPTHYEGKMGKYSKWLLNLFQKENTNLLDDSDEITDQLRIFDKNKLKYPEEVRDIGRIKTLADLIRINHDHEQQVEKSEYELRAEQVPGVDVVGSTPDWEIYIPRTYEASKYLRGQNAVWCTGRHNDDYFWKSYKNRGQTLYIFINKKDRDIKYQGAFDTKGTCTEFRDARNGSIDFEVFLTEHPDVLSLVEKDSLLKNCSQIQEAKALIDYKEGKPFTYIGSQVSEKLRGIITKVVFDSTVLVPAAFIDCSAIEEIELPEGVTEIPAQCFQSCSSLKTVKLPTSVTLIDALAFAYSANLESINLPHGLTTIGIQAFKGCDKIKIYAEKGMKINIKKLDVDFLKSHIVWEESK